MKRISLAIAALVAAVGAQAATVNVSGPGPVTTIFTPPSGTVTSATLTLTTGIGGSFTVTLNANNSGPDSVFGTISFDYNFTSSNSSLQALLGSNANPASPNAVIDKVYEGAPVMLTPGQSHTYSIPTASSSVSPINMVSILNAATAPITLGCGVRVGVTALPENFTSTSSVSGSGQGAMPTCTAVLEYTVAASQPVPEPASIALIGLALAGVGAASRRRKA